MLILVALGVLVVHASSSSPGISWWGFSCISCVAERIGTPGSLTALMMALREQAEQSSGCCL